MKTTPTAEFVRSVLDYSPKSGVFRWRHRPDYPRKWNTRFAGQIAGSIFNSGYVMLELGRGNKFLAHRVAWLYVYGEWPPKQIDHINHVRHDNKIANLRLSTQSQNLCNSNRKPNASGFRGVYYNTYWQRYEAQISLNRKVVWKATFATAEEAYAARQAALPQFHGDFTYQEED